MSTVLHVEAERSFSRRVVLVLLAAILAISVFACRAKTTSYTADVTSGMPSAGLQPMSGKLDVNTRHLRIDWGFFADVFDLRERKGWRVSSKTRTYQELGSKDLSTFAPEMANGSLCPHTQLPSQCKLVGTEIIDGRNSKKWDVYNPNGYHVYFWTDEDLGITLRMAYGETTVYQVRGLRQEPVSETVFQLPDGYEKIDRPYKP
jgi:hypothetical protein